MSHKKIIFVCADVEMYEGLLEIVKGIREDLAEDIEGDLGFVEEDDDKIVITLNEKIE